MGDIKKFLEVKKIEIKINRGDIIEVTGGPFKNERGKVTRVDEAKEELTIELLDAAIPIPITIPMESTRIIEAAEKEKK
jgi:transcriptional antiterminator NusG